MSYHRHLDTRFGDLYEIYVDDATGEFESAVRHLEEIGRDSIYYDRLSEIPPVQRAAIEYIISKGNKKDNAGNS